MSAPFGGPPSLPLNTANETSAKPAPSGQSIFDELAALPQPRKHYQRYYSTREANDNMWRAASGVHNFLRAYYHMKSGDWKQNIPFPLKARTASEWAKLPRYYVMDLDKGMAETVAPEMPSAAEIARCEWLTEDELTVYSEEYKRTGFQGGLQAYRVRWIRDTPRSYSYSQGAQLMSPHFSSVGKATGVCTRTLEHSRRCQDRRAPEWSDRISWTRAGHWVQQEQPEAVNQRLLAFLRRNEADSNR